MKPTLKQKKTEVTFSKRELTLVKMVCREKMNWEIAETLDLALRSVEKMRKRVYDKTDTSSSISLFKWAVNNGIYKF